MSSLRTETTDQRLFFTHRNNGQKLFSHTETTGQRLFWTPKQRGKDFFCSLKQRGKDFFLVTKIYPARPGIPINFAHPLISKFQI